MSALLELSDVVKEYPITTRLLQRRTGAVHAVSGVSFEVPAGATFGLVGESGCGKTTIGRMIVGLERPTGGSILFDGRDVARLPVRQRRRLQRARQLVFQDPYASLTRACASAGSCASRLRSSGSGPATSSARRCGV